MAVENGKTNVETIIITCASNVFTPTWTLLRIRGQGTLQLFTGIVAGLEVSRTLVESNECTLNAILSCSTFTLSSSDACQLSVAASINFGRLLKFSQALKQTLKYKVSAKSPLRIVFLSRILDASIITRNPENLNFLAFLTRSSCPIKCVSLRNFPTLSVGVENPLHDH